MEILFNNLEITFEVAARKIVSLLRTTLGDDFDGVVGEARGARLQPRLPNQPLRASTQKLLASIFTRVRRLSIFIAFNSVLACSQARQSRSCL